MIYSVSIKQSAVKALKNIPVADRTRVINAIERLKTNPEAGACSKVNSPGYAVFALARIALYMKYTIEN